MIQSTTAARFVNHIAGPAATSAIMPRRMAKGSSADRDGEDKEWVSHIDASTGARYYYNSLSGETLWEEDYLAMTAQRQQQQQPKPPPVVASSTLTLLMPPPAASVKVTAADDTTKKNITDSKNITLLTTRERLVAFLTEYDPSRLNEVEQLMEQYKGKELRMLKNLCRKYQVSEERQFEAFKETYLKMGGTGVPFDEENSSPSGFPSSPTKSSKSSGVQSPKHSIFSSSQSLERDGGNLQAALSETKLKYEAILEQERAVKASAISERDGQIAKLQALLETAERERDELQVTELKLLCYLVLLNLTYF